MPGKHNAGGCGCCDACSDCADLYAEYGYTDLALTGSSGSILLYSAGAPPVPETWAGFSDTNISIPNAQGGACDDSIIQQVGMSTTQQYFFSSTDPVQFFAGTFVKAGITASIVYGCTSGIPSRGIGVNVGYEVTGDVSAQYSEASFTDWTWDTHVTNGRRATKTFGDGSVAVWTRAPSSGGRTTIQGSITHTESDLTAGNPAVTTLTLPTFPYDYLGIMIGTVTIS